MYYIDKDGNKVRPVIIHRTSLGCYERTLAMVIERFAGAFPTWLAPVQVKVLPIADGHIDYANKVREELQKAGIRVEVDNRDEKIGYKIREAQVQKVSYMLVVGDKEIEAGAVGVRSRKDGDIGAQKLEEFISKIKEEIENYIR